MLSHAYQGQDDIAVLLAGDADYVPLVEAVKRTGKMVAISFFANYGIHESLKLASDDFFDVSEWFTDQWTSCVARLSATSSTT